MRIHVRPKYRATAGVTFDSWEAGYRATRQIVQANTQPALRNIRRCGSANKTSALPAALAI